MVALYHLSHKHLCIVGPYGSCKRIWQHDLNSRAGRVTDVDTLTQVVGAQDWQRTEISSAGPALAKANMNHCKHDDSLSRLACSRNHAVIIRLSRRRMISNNDWLMIQHHGLSLD